MTAGLQSINSLLRSAITLYRKNFWNYLGIVVVPVLASILFAGVVLILFTLFTVGLFNFGSIIASLISFSVVFLGIALVVGAIVLQLWSPMALLVSGLSIKPLNVVNSFKQSRTFVIPYIASAFLSGLALFGAVSVIVVPMLVLLFLLGLSPIGELLSANVLNVVGLISLIIFLLVSLIPAIVIAVWLNFVFYVIVVENKTADVLSILAYSKEVVRGHWWPVALRIFFVVLVAFVLAFVFDVIIELTGMAILSYLYNILSLLLAPLFVFYMLALYKDLVTIRGSINDMELKRSRSLMKKLMWTGIAMLTIIVVVLMASIA